MRSAPLLQLDDIVVRYGAIAAVKGVSCRVEAGEIIVLLGANGAGKSSLLRAILGLTPIDAGRVQFQGRDVTGWRTEALVKLGLTLTPEGRNVFQSLTVTENLRLGGATMPREQSAETMERMFQQFPILRERSDQLAGTLSGGEQQMLAIARSLMSSPKLLVLDEPSLGLAPVIIEEVFALISRLRDAGTTILLVEQNVAQSLTIADRAYLLELGSIAREGTAASFSADLNLHEIYLGGGD
jgi:branched-chain amino acid transport system ATP-binding protein